MKKIISIYLVFIHVFILFVLVESDFIDRVEKRLGVKAAQYEMTGYYNKLVSYHKRIDKNIPEGAVLFIGDSITQGLAVSAVCNKAVNFGIGNDTSSGVLKRIREYKSINRSALIVVLIGINDFRIRDENEIALNFDRIINSIPSEKKIIFNAVFPIDESVYEFKKRSNKAIDRLNEKLKIICAEHSNVSLLDITGLLKDDNGNLSEKFHIGDGLHLNKAGYSIWINSLSETIKETVDNE